MFTDDELSEILRILAVVLHLGNVQYVGRFCSMAELVVFCMRVLS